MIEKYIKYTDQFFEYFLSRKSDSMKEYIHCKIIHAYIPTYNNNGEVSIHLRCYYKLGFENESGNTLFGFYFNEFIEYTRKKKLEKLKERINDK